MECAMRVIRAGNQEVMKNIRHKPYRMSDFLREMTQPSRGLATRYPNRMTEILMESGTMGLVTRAVHRWLLHWLSNADRLVVF